MFSMDLRPLVKPAPVRQKVQFHIQQQEIVGLSFKNGKNVWTTLYLKKDQKV